MGREPTDPNKPKRPLTGYLRFAQEKRGSLSKSLEKSISAQAKELGKMWANLSETKKNAYRAAATKEFAKFKTQMAAYRKTDNYKNFAEEKKQYKLRLQRKKNRVPSDPNAPKRAKSAYFFYILEKRAGRPLKVVSAEWKKLKNRSAYDKKAAADKERFAKEKKKYAKSKKFQQYQKMAKEHREKVAQSDPVALAKKKAKEKREKAKKMKEKEKERAKAKKMKAKQKAQASKLKERERTKKKKEKERAKAKAQKEREKKRKMKQKLAKRKKAKTKAKKASKKKRKPKKKTSKKKKARRTTNKKTKKSKGKKRGRGRPRTKKE